ncbi:MAG: Gfo/Idh/MocA family oxidoreductase [Armatimonadetes bacterium]|nr:Gfo/Idh/MocA family oxidoreductase [Armatimonadota bacterium]
MAQQVRIGLIGCGGIARHHVNQLSQIPEAKIVALADPSAAMIEKMQANHPNTREAKVFSDYREMLDRAQLDAVEIASPHTCHFDQAMDALDRKIHVLLEKPMVCTVADARMLLQKITEAGSVALLSYQRHYQPQFRYIKQMIESGKLGKITFVAALQGQEWLKATKGSWRQDPALSGGGQLNDSGSHLLDIILWTTGLAVEEVTAYIDNLGSPVDINSAIAMKFAGGAQGTITVVGNSPCWWEDITIWGTEGAFFMRNGKLTYKPDMKSAFIEPIEDDMPKGSNPDRGFIDAILGRGELWSPPIYGLRVIELTEAAWESAEKGSSVRVDRSG